MNGAEGPDANRLEEVIAEFAELDARERLEFLLESAEDLAPLPDRLAAEKRAGRNRVQECQTEVYLWVECRGSRVQIYADVAPEAPTVKGFVSILVEAFSGRTPQEVLAVPANVLTRMGLIEVLGMVRMRGMSGIFNRIREGVEKCAGEAN